MSAASALRLARLLQGASAGSLHAVPGHLHGALTPSVGVQSISSLRSFLQTCRLHAGVPRTAGQIARSQQAPWQAPMHAARPVRATQLASPSHQSPSLRRLLSSVSGSSGGSAPAAPAPTLRARLAALLARPRAAVRSAQDKVGAASGSVYNHVPAQARQWIDVAGKPAALQRVVSLQLEAFWQRHGRKVLAAGGLFAVYLVWRTIFGMARFFVDLSDAVAAGGFVALSISMVAFAYLYYRRYAEINPSTVYHMALARLNTNPAVLEVMGAPVAGSELRAFIITGGGLRFKGLLPKRRSKRLQMIFPLAGSERRGLVSLEAKKRKGQYKFKLLAVDVPSTVGGEQRLFLTGDEALYARGGVLNELRDPFLRVLSLHEQYEHEDEVDEAADEAEEAAAKAREAAERAKAAPKPLDEGGGMYFWERVGLGAQRAWRRLAKLASGGDSGGATAAIKA